MATDNLRSTELATRRALKSITMRVTQAALPGAAGLPGQARFPSERLKLAVAYSGGLDSSVLLHLARVFAMDNGLDIIALHVHHGLSEQADEWAMHCAEQASKLGVSFDMRRIKVDAGGGNGVEGAARAGRYAALGDMCRVRRASLLLTAHHQDDQAETVLLQLLRGAGVAGLSGMDDVNPAPDLLGNADLLMGRPMLALSRVALEEFAAARGIVHVDDASNSDPRFARNKLRHLVMPVLQAQFPGFVQRFARTARHARSARQLLIELAQQDFVICAVEDQIDIVKLRALSVARCDNLLRYWFGSRGMRMPSSAWLQEMRGQLFGAKADAQILVSREDCEIHRHRDRIVITPGHAMRDPDQEPVHFAWDGSQTMDFPGYGGNLKFTRAEQGVDASWLRMQTLTLQWRSGGWRLKLASNRPTRSLKYHYQAAQVPAWDRPRLPLVTVGTRLLYAAGIGMDCHYFGGRQDGGIVLEWEFAPSVLS